MTFYLFLAAIVIISCVIFNLISNKIGVPTLLAFIVLGMLFGSDGLGKIYFDDYVFTEQLCTIALIFIIFYGGFGTRWNQAKPASTKAVLLSSIGTLLTAGFVGVFCYYILDLEFLESFLIGAVISSTDAASVFSILRFKKLNLKYNTASLLELESGSNDPFAYMLTVIMLILMQGFEASTNFTYMIFAQIVYGILGGLIVAWISKALLKHFKISGSGFNAIFMVSVALMAYSMPMLFDGNGYLSAYLTGIILGNSKISHKAELVNFFDGLTGLMQILLFFFLGLLSFPTQLPEVAFPGLCIAIFLTFIARPLAVATVLTPFKCPLNQQLLVSWAGMRGAASIVFAIMAVIHPATITNDVFHMVFFIVLFSILLQGSLLPLIAKKLEMIDNGTDTDVMKTFTDYMEEVTVQFMQLSVPAEHQWVGTKIKDIVLPPDSLLVLIERGEDRIIPNGDTEIAADDILILSGKSPRKDDGINLHEQLIETGSDWVGEKISDISSGEERIILIRRGEEVIIPNGNTIVREKDLLVMAYN